MLVDAKVVATRLGISPSTLYERVLEELLPPPIRRGRRWSRWPESEIEALERALIEGASDEALRELSRRLIERRTRQIGKDGPMATGAGGHGHGRSGRREAAGE